MTTSPDPTADPDHSSFPHAEPWGLAALLFVNLAWSSTYTVAKAVMGDISPLAISFWRLLLPAILMAPLIRREWRVHKPSRADTLRLLLMGLVGCTAANALQFLGVHYSLASNIALLIGLEPVFTILLSVLFLGEAVNARKGLGFGLALLGFLLVSGIDWQRLDLFGGKYLFGNLLMMVSTLCYCFYTIVGKGVMRRFSATMVTAYTLLWGTLGMLPLLALFDPGSLTAWLHYRIGTWVALVCLSIVCTLLGYWLWNWALGFMQASTVAMTLYVQPVAGVLFAHFLLGEQLSGGMLLGGLLIIVSVVLCSGLGRPPDPLLPTID